ncbi:unnamed protein product, partial [Ectocarpus sp. 12 AP-2014]
RDVNSSQRVHPPAHQQHQRQTPPAQACPGGVLPADPGPDEDLQAPPILEGDQAHPQRQADQHPVQHRRHAEVVQPPEASRGRCRREGFGKPRRDREHAACGDV